MQRLQREQTVMYNGNWKIPFDQIPALLAEEFGLVDIVPVRQDLYGDYCYFLGNKDGETIFVKWGGLIDSAAHEYAFNSRLWAVNKRNFNRPIFYHNNEKMKCLGMEYVECDNLEDLWREGRLTDDERRSILQQMISIYESLIEADCMHRDIKLKNYLYARDGRLLLVDFQYAVGFSDYKEREVIMQRPTIVRYQVHEPGHFKWDDAYSTLEVIKRFGSTDGSKAVYDEVHAYFKSKIGKRVLCFPYRLRLIFKRRCCQVLALFLPRKSWRNHVRHLYLRKWF